MIVLTAILILTSVILLLSGRTYWLVRGSLPQLQKDFIEPVIQEVRHQESSFREELAKNREEFSRNAVDHRKELRETLGQFQRQLHDAEKTNRDEHKASLKEFGDTLSTSIRGFNQELKTGFETLGKTLAEISGANEVRLKSVTDTLDRKLSDIQEQNAKKLDEMRATVDEKLQKTLNDRLAESFKMVSENLEAVNRGLGEMKSLANGVGDLKKVLANVKTRGSLGEIQLGSILEQILSPYQYEKNVVTKKSGRDQVEFAIKLPGKDSLGSQVWLPVDSKFPSDPYERLIAAYDAGQPDLVKTAFKELEAAVKKSARDIRDKYLEPPGTTDFGILFFPIEGLYAEVVRQPSLLETLHRDLRVVVTGPTTLAALLNSLQMGFQTLAFEKRSHEIREILGAVKREFGNFGKVLGDVQKKLHGASDDLEHLVGTRTRKIQGKLRGVEELPEERAKLLLGSVEDEPVEDEAEAS